MTPGGEAAFVHVFGGPFALAGTDQPAEVWRVVGDVWFAGHEAREVLGRWVEGGEDGFKADAAGSGLVVALVLGLVRLGCLLPGLGVFRRRGVGVRDVF